VPLEDRRKAAARARRRRRSLRALSALVAPPLETPTQLAGFHHRRRHADCARARVRRDRRRRRQAGGVGWGAVDERAAGLGGRRPRM